jgi:hypothetical protein
MKSDGANKPPEFPDENETAVASNLKENNKSRTFKARCAFNASLTSP